MINAAWAFIVPKSPALNSRVDGERRVGRHDGVTGLSVCIGAALSLEANDPRLEELTHEFYTSAGDLTKHFPRRHLDRLSDDAQPRCEVSDLELKCKTHLQSHALLVHGTMSPVLVG